jgi:hypothetical protein
VGGVLVEIRVTELYAVFLLTLHPEEVLPVADQLFILWAETAVG